MIRLRWHITEHLIATATVTDAFVCSSSPSLLILPTAGGCSNKERITWITDPAGCSAHREMILVRLIPQAFSPTAMDLINQDREPRLFKMVLNSASEEVLSLLADLNRLSIAVSSVLRKVLIPKRNSATKLLKVPFNPSSMVNEEIIRSAHNLRN